MPFDIRTLFTIDHTRSNLADLITACRARGPLCCHDIELTNDVMRKAKGLQISLGKLKEAVDDRHHQPIKEESVKQDPFHLRLNFQPHLYELARFVSYGRKRDKELREKSDDLQTRSGKEKVMWALFELTAKDEATGLTVLKPEVRKLCRGLLGPAPKDDDYSRYNSVNRRSPPPEHQPPAPEVEEAKPVKKRGG